MDSWHDSICPEHRQRSFSAPTIPPVGMLTDMPAAKLSQAPAEGSIRGIQQSIFEDLEAARVVILRFSEFNFDQP